MDFAWSDKPIEIALNAAYLLPMLKSIKTETFTFGINDAAKPIIIQAEGFQGLLMPMA